MLVNAYRHCGAAHTTRERQDSLLAAEALPSCKSFDPDSARRVRTRVRKHAGTPATSSPPQGSGRVRGMTIHAGIRAPIDRPVTQCIAPRGLSLRTRVNQHAGAIWAVGASAVNVRGFLSMRVAFLQQLKDKQN